MRGVVMHAPGDVRVETRPEPTMTQAIGSTRPAGHVGFVGVLHDVALPGDKLFYSHVHIHGGPAPYAGSCPT